MRTFLECFLFPVFLPAFSFWTTCFAKQVTTTFVYAERGTVHGANTQLANNNSNFIALVEVLLLFFNLLYISTKMYICQQT